VGCATSSTGAPPAGAPTPAAGPAAKAPPPPPLPELVFRAGEPPWRALGISIVLASPKSTEASLDALGAKLGWPLRIGGLFFDGVSDNDPEDLHGLKLGRQMLDQLDPARPVVFVVLGPGIGVNSGDCWGLAFRDAAGARRGLAFLGVETGRTGGESARRLPDGTTVVAGVHERTLLISTSPRMLAAAGPLVEALQAGHVEHVLTAAVYPQIFPVGAGVIAAGLDAAVTSELQKARDQQAAERGRGETPRVVVTDGLVATARHLARRLAEVVADTHAARIELDLDEKVGLAMRVVVEPLEGSALARALTPPTPFRLDARLDGASATHLLVWGAPPGTPSFVDEVFDASGRAGKALHAEHDKWRRLFAGPASCAGGLRDAPGAWLCAQPFARGAKAADVSRRYTAFSKALVAWLREVGFTPASVHPAVAARTEAGLFAMAPERKTADAALAVRVAPSAPPPALASILAHAEGADVLVAVDFVGMIRDATATLLEPAVKVPLSKLGALRGFLDLRAPIGLTARSGARAAYELQVPFETLRDLSSFAKPYVTGSGTISSARSAE
jgi:hypothetical protein